MFLQFAVRSVCTSLPQCKTQQNALYPLLLAEEETLLHTLPQRDKGSKQQVAIVGEDQANPSTATSG